ncbi:MAG TPA: hypothetical protein VFS72_06380 [Agromyces sp.]|nr:hypothetical protein [Agromyces sp.]
MDIQYRPELDADVATDDEGRVRHVRHVDEHWRSSEERPRDAAIEYLRTRTGGLETADASLEHLDEPVSYTEPREEGSSLRLVEEKQQFDSSTVAFAQTYLGVPVWRTGVTVTVKTERPALVVESTSTTIADVSAELPSPESVERHLELSAVGERRSADTEAESAPTPADDLVRVALGLSDEAMGDDDRSTPDASRLRVNQSRFYVYRYDPAARQPNEPAHHEREQVDLETDDVEPTIPLPPVPDTIRPGGDYLVSEVVFTLPYIGLDMLNWRALIEVETDAVLWLRALIAGANGLVFTLDPITSTGDLTNTADRPNGTLDPLRDDVALEHLGGPVGGFQSLAGDHVMLSDDDAPSIAPPTEATGTDFDYHARTDDFAAVSAYYHANGFFAMVESLGFDVSTYFDGTTFPVHVDHRASASDPNGIEINAFCAGDAQGDGIGLAGYCLANLDDLVNPLGRAVDKYVHWHEIGGHGILWDHVDSPNFGFSHSAGDGLAGVQSDPESLLRAQGMVERFRYTPFRPIRWMNRAVADDWGWGGPNDNGGYDSEQILATCHFRIYRSIGGDSADLARRRLASRLVTYLVLRAVGDLTPMTNPGSPDDWCDRLMATDAFDWTTEGLHGGAYHKVIRWSFEQQGLFRPGGAPTTDPGAPPAVDVYIDDGRAGTYLPHLSDDEFAATPDIWNRRFPDGGTSHEDPLAGFPSYCYVRVHNRGTSAAADPSVKLFTGDSAGGLEWPTDWTVATTAQLAASGPIASGGDAVIGPFSWSSAAPGQVSLLASAAATGDSSNADTITGSIAHWRLIPNDNNIGQRDVTAVQADACEHLGALADHLTTLGLQQGLENSLTSKLRGAKRDCERGNTQPACGKLGAFDNEVRAKTGQGITPAQAAVMRAHSDAIAGVLGCG